MSGDNGGSMDASDRKEGAVPLQLTISFQTNGEMRVEGPGNGQAFDEPLCFWMLDKAKDFIKYRNSQAYKSSLYVPERLRGKIL